MNQQIQKLAEQANASVAGAGFTMAIFHEKFAELIVRECMDVLDPGEHQLIARFQARQMLAEHFGIDSQPVSNVDRILQTVRTRGQQ